MARRRYYLPSRSKAHTRARWFSLFFFCYAAFIKWKLLSFLALDLEFVFIWGRIVHMTTESKLWRQAIWTAGFTGTLATLLASSISETHTQFVYTAWLGSWGILLCYGFFSLCRYGYRANIEYDHLAWASIFFILGLIPSLITGNYIEKYPMDYVNLSLLLILYLRMRIPVLWGSMVNPQKHTIKFLEKTDSIHIDHHTVYDLLEYPRALKDYLKFVDEGVRDIFLSVEYDLSKYVSGYYSDKSQSYKQPLETIGITYSRDVFLLHQQIVDFMHLSYDSKYFGSKMLFFFCPCLKPQTFSSFDDSSTESDRGVELDSPSSLSMSSDEVIYAELRDFNSSEENE